jgi:alkyl hydroperoxide reductase subunit AhpC
MLGETVPDFTAESTQGRLNLYDYLGDNWGILFTHPSDFTPVCTTELGTLAQMQNDFDKRGVKLLALSVDTLDSHTKWITDIEAIHDTKVKFPIIADFNFKVSLLYCFVHPKESDCFTVRSVVVIGPDKSTRLLITYPASIGRNFDEILRAVDALQLAEKYSVSTPANWKVGDDVIVPIKIQTTEIPASLKRNLKEITPYLRTVKNPESL